MKSNQPFALLAFLLIIFLFSPAFGDGGGYTDDDRYEGNHRKTAAGAVFVMTNDAESNEVIMYRRSFQGTLTPLGRFPTGGRGSGFGKTIGIDPLGSQNSLILGEKGRYLFAVNAGDDTVTIFRVKKRYLKFLDNVPSGGRFPVSLTVRKRILYVLNAGANDGLGNGAPGNITGFQRRGNRLVQIENSTRPLVEVPQNPTDSGSDFPNILATPAQVQFTPRGDSLVVTIKDGVNAQSNSIWTFDVHKDDGYLTDEFAAISPTAGPVPFGFTFDSRDHLLVTDPGVSTITSYELDDGAVVGPNASVETGQAATCWIVGTKRRHADLAYAANTGSGTLSGYRVHGDGTLSEVGIFPVGDGALNIDLAVTHDGRYVYTQNGGFGTVSIYRVERNGALAFVDEVDVVDPVSGFQGIAAW
jgi:6-phosphogluconolactonase (cycloisomerase 2 family)